jgi:hypothetical protein
MLPPHCRSCVFVVLDALIICFATGIAVFGIPDVSIDFLIRIRVTPLLSSFLPLFAIAAAAVLLCSYLLLLQLL